MERKLLNKVKEWVDAYGYEGATARAESYIKENVAHIKNMTVDNASAEMTLMKSHLAILEFLYCDSEMVDADMEKMCQ